MRKISKEDHVRHFTYIARLLCVLAVILCSIKSFAGTSSDAFALETAYFDSIEVSLLTCSPHEEIYSLYGHTALRFRDLHTANSRDVVFNWGQFDFNTPHFATRFVFGLTDYQLGMENMQMFCEYYKYWGSSVTEQVLNLSSEEKQHVLEALTENLKPENVTYRYNIFHNNCSTLPRDLIERCINGKINYETRTGYEPSFREMIHEKTRNHEWLAFGCDMLLGLKADFKTCRKEQEFLPENLLYDFDHARIKGNDGSWRSLIKERRMPVMPGVQIIERDFPLSPLCCAIILLLLSIVIFAFEWQRRRIYIFWDVTLMLLTGLAGCVLFVMIFSQHPTTSLNLQLLLVNPFHLFFIPSVIRRHKTHYWPLLAGMALLFCIGGIWQHYAEGLMILALCLLLRYWTHYKHEK